MSKTITSFFTPLNSAMLSLFLIVFGLVEDHVSEHGIEASFPDSSDQTMILFIGSAILIWLTVGKVYRRTVS